MFCVIQASYLNFVSQIKIQILYVERLKRRKFAKNDKKSKCYKLKASTAGV